MALIPQKIDLTGQKFGRLTVVNESGFVRSGGQKKIKWLCTCDCGNRTEATSGLLKSGNTKSCGCLSKELASKRNMDDLTGQRFGRLVVLEDAGRSCGGKVRWLCRCDCGGTTTVIGGNLKSGRTSSCGCIRAELSKKRVETHGESHTRLYRVWQGMKERCESPRHISYQFYGARGIKVHECWRNSYENFRDWALSNGYDLHAKRGKCTLDRIDVNGNYAPDNCRWVSMEVQNQNKRTSTTQRSLNIGIL